MISYFIIIAIPTLLYCIEEYIPTKKGVFKKMAIIFLIVVSSLRYGFGVDFFTYSDAFLRIKNGIMTDEFEIGYKLLNIIISKFNLDFNVLLFVIASFNLILVYKCIEENVVKYKNFAIFIYISYFDLFFYSLSSIRQSIVISIVLYTFKYLQNKNFKKYCIWMLIGSLFHISALYMIPFYFIYQYFRNKNFLKTSFILISATILYSMFINIIVEFLKVFFSYKLYYYFYIVDNSLVKYDFIFAVLLEIILVLWIFISNYIKNKSNKDEKNKIYMLTLTITFYIFFKVIQILNYNSLIPRFQMYFYCFFILVIPNIMNVIPKKYLPIIKIIIIIVFICMFIFNYNELSENNIENYKTFRIFLN